MFIRKLLPVLALVMALGLVAPSSAWAANGPEGIPVYPGKYIAANTEGYPAVKAPLSLPYAFLDKAEDWRKGPIWTFGNVDLVLQPDHNLVMYPKGDWAAGNYSRSLWASNTRNSGAVRLLFQKDGNLVLYTWGYEKAVWDTKTQDICKYELQLITPALSLQSDSNMVIYCGTPVDYTNGYYGEWNTRPLWSTHTAGA